MRKLLSHPIAAALLLLLLMAGCFTGNSIHRQTVAANPSKPAYSILIDTDENVIYLLKEGKLFKSYSCATGTDVTPSPTGCFKIISKQHWGEGFGGYYLGLNCKWGTYGIHGTTQPGSIGSDASHGCFRMYNEDVKELYDYVSIGTIVICVSGCYGVFGTGIQAFGPGMYGSDVQAVQRRLSDLGYYKGTCNGSYNAAGFRNAVHKYQKDNGLIVSDTVTVKMIHSLGFIQFE